MEDKIFKYVIKNKHTGVIYYKVYSLEQIEENGLKCLFDIENYDIIATLQYTGLNDKNGTRIFEGDIDKERRVIIWNDKLNLHCLHRKNRDEYMVCYYPFTKRDAIEIEIHGNVHDKNEE